MRALMAISVLCWSLNVGAACPVDHPRQQPALPDGATASGAEMHRAQLEAENYIFQARTYMECGMMNRRQYNLLLSQLDTFASLYNEEVIEYQVRSNMIAEK